MTAEELARAIVKKIDTVTYTSWERDFPERFWRIEDALNEWLRDEMVAAEKEKG